MVHRCFIPQKSFNGNRTVLKWVPIVNPLKSNRAPISNSVFEPLLSVGIDNAATGFINVLNLRVHFLNCNAFIMGDPLQPVVYPIAAATSAVFGDKCPRIVDSGIGNGCNGDQS